MHVMVTTMVTADRSSALKAREKGEKT